jgi:hypothetical protein
VTESLRLANLRAALASIAAKAGASRMVNNAWEWGAALRLIEQAAHGALEQDDRDTEKPTT